MSDQPDSFADRVLRGSAGARGACPSDAELMAYAARELTAEESAGVERHVMLCGSCELAVERLRAVDDGPLPEGAKTRAWAVVSGAETRIYHWAWIRWMAVGAVAAGAFVIGRVSAPPASLPASVAAVRRVDPQGGPMSAERVELDAVRGPSNAVVVAGTGPDLLVLSVALPARPGTKYSGQLYHGDGRTIGPPLDLQPSRDGYFWAAVRRADVGHGVARLVVTKDGSVVADLPFRVD